MNISKNNTDNKEKIELFVEAFGDSIETAKDFFNCRDIITVTEYVGNRLAAMASLVPIYAMDTSLCAIERIASIGYINSGFYIYGVCVAKNYRGMGLFSSIMKKTETEASEKKADFVCLVPADEGLAQTYKKWGYDIEILPIDKSFEKNKKILLASDDFKKFACVENDMSDAYRMRGLMKVINKKMFNPLDKEYAFGDNMGDI